MDQSEFEFQLKIWKDLAVSKQVMMSAAADALGLDQECSPEELKQALDAAIKKGIEAEADISEAKEQARVAIAVMEEKVEKAEKARAASEAAREEALSAQANAEQQLSAGRAANARELQAAKKEVTEKDQAIKAINKALADTPENVLKKLKTLKKQKMDEANSRKRAEADERKVKMEKQKLEQELKDLKKTLGEGNKVIELVRELHELCTTQRDELKTKGADAAELKPVPMLNEELLEALSKAFEVQD